MHLRGLDSYCRSAELRKEKTGIDGVGSLPTAASTRTRSKQCATDSEGSVQTRRTYTVTYLALRSKSFFRPNRARKPESRARPRKRPNPLNSLAAKDTGSLVLDQFARFQIDAIKRRRKALEPLVSTFSDMNVFHQRRVPGARKRLHQRLIAAKFLECVLRPSSVPCATRKKLEDAIFGPEDCGRRGASRGGSVGSVACAATFRC